MAKPVIFDLEFTEIFNDAVDHFQSQTDYALERQDAERLMLQVFSNMIYKWGSNWQEASLQNYLKYKTGDQLDAFGESNNTPRLANTPSESIVRFIFTASLEVFYPIHKNTIVTGSNNNGTFTFKVLETVYAQRGDSSIDIKVEEFIDNGTNSGALANGIEIGDINSLSDAAGLYSQVDSVSNVIESFNGHPSESDDHYKKRLEYVNAGSSTAGVFDEYIFHALAAHHGVLDVGALKPGWEINLYVLPYDFETLILGDSGSQISNMNIMMGLDTNSTDNGRLYWSLTGTTPTRTLTLYKDSAKTIPVAEYPAGPNGTGLLLFAKPGYTVYGSFDLTGSTNDTDVANYLETYAVPMCAVNQMMNPTTGNSKVRPINDIVNVALCLAKSFTISKLDITIKSSNIETVKAQVTQVVNAYRDMLQSEAGKNAVRGELDGYIRQIDGVYDADIEFNSVSTVTVVEATMGQFLTCVDPTGLIDVSVYAP